MAADSSLSSSLDISFAIRWMAIYAKDIPKLSLKVMFWKSPSALEQPGYAVVLITWELTWVSDILPSTRVFNFCRRWPDLKKVEANSFCKTLSRDSSLRSSVELKHRPERKIIAEKNW